MRIRARVLTKLPATLTASGGLSVEKVNGVWTFAPDWTALAVEETLPDPESRQLWALDPTSGVYTRLSVQALIDNVPAGPTGATGATGPTGPQGPSGAGSGDMLGSANLAVGAGGVANAATAFANIKQAASTTATGVAELATDAEAIAKVDTARVLTPSNLAALGSLTTFAGLVELATDAETIAKSDTARAITPSNLAAIGSSATFAGLVELATDAETITGTDTARAVTPSNLTGASIFGNIPQNSRSAAYTLVASDQSKHILHPSADTTARIWTIPANASVAFPIGTSVTFINQNAGGVITIAITTDTMRLAGAGTTGSRTLAANGVATAIKITSTEWIISGTGLT